MALLINENGIYQKKKEVKEQAENPYKRVCARQPKRERVGQQRKTKKMTQSKNQWNPTNFHSIVEPTNNDNEYDIYGAIHNHICVRLNNFFLEKIKAGTKGYSGKLDLPLIYKEVYHEAANTALFYFNDAGFDPKHTFKSWVPFITAVIENKQDPASFINDSSLSSEGKGFINDHILPLTKTIPKSVIEINNIMNKLKSAESSLNKTSMSGDVLLKVYVSIFKWSFYNASSNGPASIHWGAVVCDGIGGIIGGLATGGLGALTGGAAGSAIEHYCFD